MPDNHALVAVYNTPQDAQGGVFELQKAGFDLKNLSIAGRDYQPDRPAVGYYLVPGVGPVLVAGPLAGYIVSAVESAVDVEGLSAIGSGLLRIGLPKNSILKYESAIRADKFLVIAHGTRNEVQRARRIVGTIVPGEISVHVTNAPKTTGAGGAGF